jgi:methylthioribose-1-phosphate isomerase
MPHMVPVAALDEDFSPLRWQGGALELLDQTRLPAVEAWLTCRHPEQVADAIRRLAVRGAPAIGVAAAYGLALGFALPLADESPDGLQRRFSEVAELLGGTRPTAVNLRWAIERGRGVCDETLGRVRDAGGELGGPGREVLYGALLFWARGVHAADVAANRRIGEHGAALFAPESRVLTHCNTGALATAGYGTALGVIQSSWRQGRVALVWVDETRPLLQGARLTAWELRRLGIPFRVLPDAAAGSLLARGEVDRIVVGADRIAANGDTANKIGTYPLAVLAHRHGVPFYVAAPLSTIDPATPTGADIPIEERSPEEITTLAGHPITPEGTPALNLAFDLTPADLITNIVTDAGVLQAPYEESIARALAT